MSVRVALLAMLLSGCGSSAGDAPAPPGADGASPGGDGAGDTAGGGRSDDASMLDAGVRDFTFEDCLESYRISSLYPLLLTVCMSMFLAHTDRDREVWTQLLRGSAELVLDLGAAEVLE